LKRNARERDCRSRCFLRSENSWLQSHTIQCNAARTRNSWNTNPLQRCARCRKRTQKLFLESRVTRPLAIGLKVHSGGITISSSIQGVFVRCVSGDLYQLLFTDRPKCYDTKQRFEGSACAKSLGLDRRKV